MLAKAETPKAFGSYICASYIRSMVMNNKTIYLIRHGETVYNKLKMVQGSSIDAELNETGVSQADAFYSCYKHIPFDKVYTSRLQRTYQTVDKFINQSKIPTQQLIGLNEMSWGKKEGRPITVDDDVEYQKILNQWREGNMDAKVGDGESPNQVLDRQIPAWKYIMSQDQEKTILICMHGRAMRILLCHLIQESLSQMDIFKHTNTCLYKLTHQQGTYQILEANNMNHLEHLGKERIDIQALRVR